MKRLMIISVILAAGVATMVGCGNKSKKDGVPAFDVANMDTTVRPGDDFYHYADGGWMAKNPLPAEFSRFGIFDRLRDTTLSQLHTLLDDVKKMDLAEGTIAQKINTLYTLGMDSVKLNAEGANPIAMELLALAAIADKAGITEAVAEMHREGIYPYFSFFVDSDEKNSAMNIGLLYQGGLGIGDRDYYLGSDADSERVRTAYLKYVERLFTLSDFSAEEAKAGAEAVWDIEKRLAEVSYSREVLRDSHKNYNKVQAAQWIADNNGFDWGKYFAAMGVAADEDVVVKQLEFFTDAQKALADVSLDAHKYYLAYNLISSAASYLSDDFAEASFEFHGRVMSGREEMQPRWKRALGTTDGALSEALGQLYVEKYFPASSKESMLTLVGNLQTALGQRIEALAWMTDATKAKALEKLAAFHIKVGYPDKWRDYSGLEITGDSYWANVRRSRIFDFEYMLSQKGQPVDVDKWFMSPQTVNAYYNPTTNEICFPAGILQPPFFNPDADAAVNYGAIGVVIGHEMTHGFDDQGRNYDAIGNLNDWWTAEDAAQFEARANVLVEQFDAIEVAPGVHANGEFTLGENIADQGGLMVSHQAYHNSLAGGEIPADIDGFTAEQRFYLGYATVWAQNIRPEEVLRLTKIDPHSQGEWRVNATLRNVDDFYAAFGVAEGDKMYLAPQDRVLIW